LTTTKFYNSASLVKNFAVALVQDPNSVLQLLRNVGLACYSKQF